jgi:hypothetical protein
MTVDKARLLAWLTGKTTARSALVASVYQGLADRIRRGDFDEDANS